MHSNQENKVYIGGLDKAELLVSLYSFALYRRRHDDFSNMSSKKFVEVVQSEQDISIVKKNSLEDAKYAVKEKKYSGYFRFLELKVDLSGDYLNTCLYNRDKRSC